MTRSNVLANDPDPRPKVSVTVPVELARIATSSAPVWIWLGSAAASRVASCSLPPRTRYEEGGVAGGRDVLVELLPDRLEIGALCVLVYRLPWK
jgi:hypothetical protein